MNYDDDVTRDGSVDDPTSGIPTGAFSGDKIGNYRILESLGEGGMGEVYLAQQIEPIKRRVALKLIKLGMDTREVVARFESERQALAMMTHENVARILDAGSTEAGRPYFVMEYVPGEPITTYCDRHKLDITQRLELFIPVCRAIHHAHQKGIIHRDIKPSNVLVTIEDGKPVPKVIDFGVAKATQQALTEKTVYTMQGRMVGTPAYMSPEQAEMTGLNVDTTSDVYSLGVLLYELLVGAQPFDAVQLREAGIAEIHRIIREVEPPKPSTKISSLGEDATDIAARRQIELRSWRKRLDGELDWITMKALEKDRSRRYETANALIQDIEHYLKDEPVKAGPPSTTYRVRKFAKRHRTGVIAAAVVVVALVLGALGASVGMVRAKRAERVATQEAEASRYVSEFMVDMFDVSAPSEARGNSITAREVLDRGLERIETGLQDQPLTQARMMNTMGRVYGELGLYRESLPLLEQSIELMHENDAGETLEAATVMDNLGRVLRQSGEFDLARPHLEKALAIREERLGPVHPALAQSLNSYGNLLWQTGDLEQARAYYERALSMREASLDPDDPDIAITLNNLGGVCMGQGNYEEARHYLVRGLEIRERAFGEDHPSVAKSLHSLAALTYSMGDFEASRRYDQRCLALREKIFGPNHPDVAESLESYAIVLDELGDYETAQEMYERSLEIRENVYGRDHHEVANSLGNLATFHHSRGRYEKSMELATRAIAIREASLGPEHPKVALDLGNLAINQMAVGEYAQAQANLERALRVSEQNYGSEHGALINPLNNLGLVHVHLGEYEQARHYLERSIEVAEGVYGSGHPDVATACRSLGALLRDTGDTAGARPYLERSLEINTQIYGEDHLATADSKSHLGLLFYYEGDHVRARDLIAEALVVQIKYRDQGHPDIAADSYNLACLSSVLGDKEAALQYLRQAVDNGFANSSHIEQDPDLAPLHGDPGFEQIVRDIQSPDRDE